MLARTLGDPDLRVAYWLPEYDAYADADGQPVELPEPGGVALALSALGALGWARRRAAR